MFLEFIFIVISTIILSYSLLTSLDAIKLLYNTVYPEKEFHWEEITLLEVYLLI